VVALVVTGEDMAAAVMDQDLDSDTNPPSYEDLRIAKMLIPLFVELQVPWLNKTHKKDRFISVFLCGLKLNTGI
jgi:hypothetical protein